MQVRKNTVVDTAILTGQLKVRLDDAPDGLPVTVSRDEVRIVRENKPKMNKN
ncbi:MAG: hypothetical protein ACLR6O_05440 [Eubacterium sp.]